MNVATSNLLDEALGATKSRVLLIEDCVETSGAFLLHHLIKRAFSAGVGGTGVVVFVALAQPFSHYDRILRKLACNLTAQMDNNRFFFFDMLKLECPGVDGRNNAKSGLVDLYGKVQRAVEVSASLESNQTEITLVIDDVSLLDVAAYGSTDHVLDFLHYCHTLTSELECSLVMLNHEDIYSTMAGTRFILQLEHLADIVIKAEPLATGLATDVHGQLTVVNKRVSNDQRYLVNKIHTFHFKVKENGVEYFFPGSYC